MANNIIKKPLIDTLRDQIERERVRQEMAIYALAKKSGVDYSPLHGFLSGKCGMGIPSIEKLLAALGGSFQVKFGR